MPFPSANLNKKTIYACEPISPNQWAEPIPIKVKVSPLTSDVDIMAYGVNVNSYYRMNGTRAELSFLHYQIQPKMAWRFYVDKPIPLVHDVTQQKSDSANYEMEMPKTDLNETVIMLKKIPNR